ncbi:MAG TPA: cobalamin-dependent protein [Alphaproteobacteria bacterium]|jgi:methylmalonyl-CoA mutase C-terminal domain/subunit|nr:cobalamin-dependent protein [Alphaproteobacteria bacterium]MDP6270946.1 cobalamin-dependent protein [Alphaproteobacteria bacterium]HJM48883.1 cobalamin-dependent protein [Alphaproteobacteria bacterium]
MAIRVLLAKPGLDTHEGGVKLVAAALRDAGMEVIYTGVFQTSESIVATALEEDVDVVGLSFLSGAHLALTRDIVAGLEAAGLGDRAVICGGIIPADDVAGLKELGVRGVYGPGTALAEIVGDVRSLVGP